MNADPDLPSELGIDQGRCHFQTAADGRTDRILELLEQPGSRHKSIADSLDFLKAVSGCDPLENDEECVKSRHHVFRFVLVAIGA